MHLHCKFNSNYLVQVRGLMGRSRWSGTSFCFCTEASEIFIFTCSLNSWYFKAVLHLLFSSFGLVMWTQQCNTIRPKPLIWSLHKGSESANTAVAIYIVIFFVAVSSSQTRIQIRLSSANLRLVMACNCACVSVYSECLLSQRPAQMAICWTWVGGGTICGFCAPRADNLFFLLQPILHAAPCCVSILLSPLATKTSKSMWSHQ